MTIHIGLDGDEELIANLRKMGGAFARTMEAAGRESAEEVINTRGVRIYPTGNHTPQAFATDRSRKYFFAALSEGRIEVPYRRGGKRSERYGTQFKVSTQGPFAVKISNRTSYGGLLGGEKQSDYMAAGGWKKLMDAAKEKMTKIKDIYQRWINRLIRLSGL